MEDPNQDNGKYSLYITGITQSLTYDFGGRAESSTPDDVTNLTLIIYDENGQAVYERRFYDYNYYGYGYPYYEDTVVIPDTVYIPELPGGSYKLVAVTADFYYDYHYDSDMLVYPYHTSPGPVYAGYEEFELIEENQAVAVDMNNISCRIRVKLKEGQKLDEYGYLGLTFETNNTKAYSLFDGEFVPWDEGYNNYIYTSLGSYYYWTEDGEIVESIVSSDVYILPQTIIKLRIDYYDHYGSSILQEIEIEPDIVLTDGDAIPFTIDLKALIEEGTNPGIFNWEDIEWNELDEVTIP